MVNTTREQKRFFEFRDEVKKYEVISTMDLTILISRFTEGNMGRRFFNSNLKLRYYSFWIKRLHNSGLIKPKGNMAWEVIK